MGIFPSGVDLVGPNSPPFPGTSVLAPRTPAPQLLSLRLLPKICPQSSHTCQHHLPLMGSGLRWEMRGRPQPPHLRPPHPPL